MRSIALILVAYLSLLTTSPAVCNGYLVLRQDDLCCNITCETECSKDLSTNKPSGPSEKESSCLSCCSLQNSHCSFVAVPEFNFNVEMSLNTKRPPVKNDKVLSDYLSDCWQPPELI